MSESEQSLRQEKSSEKGGNWDYSKQISRFKNSQIVAGVVRNPRNLLWQTWVSLYRNDVTCLTAHRLRERAEETINKFCKAYQAGKLFDPQAVAGYIKRMSTDKKPGPLPEATLREIEDDISNLFFGLLE